MRNFARTAAIGGIVLAGLTGQAFAHAHLKSAIPAVNGTVSVAPAKLDLSFSESVNLRFTGVTVAGPGQSKVATGQAKLLNHDMTLMVPVTATLGAGKYTVSWHALSTDGHKTHGTYSFTVKP